VVTVYVMLLFKKHFTSVSVDPFANNRMLQELLRRMKKDLEKIKGFSEGKVEKLKEAGKKMMVRIMTKYVTRLESLIIGSRISMGL
jgi:hypothetical protein